MRSCFLSTTYPLGLWFLVFLTRCLTCHASLYPYLHKHAGCIRARFGDSFDSRARPGSVGDGSTGNIVTNMPTRQSVSLSGEGHLIALFARCENAGGGARKRNFFRSFTGDGAHTRHNTQAVCSPYPRLNTPRIKNTHEDCGIIVWSRHGALYGIATTLSEGAFLHVWLSAWLPRGTLTRDLHRFAHQVGRDGVLSHLWGRGPGAVVSTCMLIGGMAFFRTTTVGAHVLDFS